MGTFDNLKSIGKVLQEAGKIEQYQQILETQEKMLGMQKKIIELEEKKKELEENLKIKEKLSYENNTYWIKEAEKRDGPFCSRCYDKNGDLIRIHPLVGNSKFSECPECKNRVLTTAQEPEPPRASPVRNNYF
jgi:hypothetical protein